MKLQTENIIGKTSKAVNLSFYHPLSSRLCFAWFPISLIKYLPNNQISIPYWLWKSIKSKL